MYYLHVHENPWIKRKIQCSFQRDFSDRPTRPDSFKLNRLQSFRYCSSPNVLCGSLRLRSSMFYLFYLFIYLFIYLWIPQSYHLKNKIKRKLKHQELHVLVLASSDLFLAACGSQIGITIASLWQLHQYISAVGQLRRLPNCSRSTVHQPEHWVHIVVRHCGLRRDWMFPCTSQSSRGLPCMLIPN